MNLHVGANGLSGLVHNATVTPVNTHESKMLSKLMPGKERWLHCDSAYRGEKEQTTIRETVRNVHPRLHQRTRPSQPVLEEREARIACSMCVANLVPGDDSALLISQ